MCPNQQLELIQKGELIAYFCIIYVDRVKPWNRVRINLGLGLRGPDIDIRPGLDNRHLIIECHRSL